MERVFRWIGIVVLAGIPEIALAADPGIITVSSRYSVEETIERFEGSILANSDQGWMVFTRLDHAAAADKYGLKLLPRTVVVFGNPRLGTSNMVKAPTLGIDLPLKALVWQDDQGKVWLSYNSAPYLTTYLYPRHGVEAAAGATDALARFLDAATGRATQ